MNKRELLIQELFPLYLKEFEEDLQQLKSIIIKRESSKIRSILHKIIGSSKYFETKKIELISTEMNSYCKIDYWDYVSIKFKELTLELNVLKVSFV